MAEEHRDKPLGPDQEERLAGLLRDIIEHLDELSAAESDERHKQLLAYIRRHNQGISSNVDHVSKKDLIPFYQQAQERWGLNADQHAQLMHVLQIKPRRTASGVATITVITKPWPCSSNCLYCPSDLTMPKSYLGDEPACQRAERNYFDPYLQVSSRLRSLMRMGHVTDKIELIVLGGTWSDYPEDYQIWFISELFRALNEAGVHADALRVEYERSGMSNDAAMLRQRAADLQAQVHAGTGTYNSAWQELYAQDDIWKQLSTRQKAAWEELEAQQHINEDAEHRMVGLVIETRPDLITVPHLTTLRRLGCTKVQMGIQSLRPEILKANHRNIDVETIQHAFTLLRLFGFKIHAHFMVNLLGAAPEEDIEDYKVFANEEPYQPDEVKLYPCVLINGTPLCSCYEAGTWQPYPEDVLVEVLAHDVLNTPAFVRISRMIRDFSAHDIAAGSKKINLRQRVEEAVERSGQQVREIRMRELSTDTACTDDLRLERVSYVTQGSQEHFLQWVLPDGRIAGFLRLSLPDQQLIDRYPESPIAAGQAMIREIHVYGQVAQLHRTSQGAQHLGLGRQLIEEASRIARDAGYSSLNVISSVGTRNYYRTQGFTDAGLYQNKPL